MIQFFMNMIPPTVTAQQKGVTFRNGKPFFYEKDEVKKARSQFRTSLARFVPDAPVDGAVRLVTKWFWPTTADHKAGEYKTTKPDTDNSIKLLKDAMTDMGFWNDDSQVASEITEKMYNDIPGIFVRIEALP